MHISEQGQERLLSHGFLDLSSNFILLGELMQPQGERGVFSFHLRCRWTDVELFTGQNVSPTAPHPTSSFLEHTKSGLFLSGEKRTDKSIADSGNAGDPRRFPGIVPQLLPQSMHALLHQPGAIHISLPKGPLQIALQGSRIE